MLDKLQNKLSTELSNEELLKLLDTKLSNKKQFKNPYLNFISKYNIQSGIFEVTVQVLLQLYNVDHPRVKQQGFTRNFKKYIDWKKNRHQLVFLINKDILEISASVEKLLEPKNKSAKKTRDRKRHIESFLETFNLKPGNNSIETAVLVDLYDRWCYTYKRKKIHMNEFYGLLPIYLPLVNKKYYKVHDDLFKVVSLETIKRITKRNAKEKV